MNVDIEYWNDSLESFEPYDVDESPFEKDNEYFLKIIGDVNNKKLLDIGCGNGETSMYFARRGAIVTSIDMSETAVNNTLKNAELHKVKVNAFRLDALEINKISDKFDLIIGKFILHHIEPFVQFVENLYKIVDNNGRAVFYENNARNKILMFFRKTVVGRFGVPKYGDNQEYPFTYLEFKMIKNRFKTVKLYYPQFRFFSLLAPYIFKNNEKSNRITRKIDNFVYTKIPFFNRYSYIQIIDAYK